MKYTYYNKYILTLLSLIAFQPAQSFGIPTFIKSFATTVKSYFVKPKKILSAALPEELAVTPTQVLNDLKQNNKGPKSKVPKKRSVFINHLQLMQELKLRFNAFHKIVPSTLVDSDTLLTQTEAYQTVCTEGVQSSFGGALDTHKELIDTIITREKEFSKTHYFFYHAHDRDFIILHDFIKVLDKYLRLINISTNFVPLRYKAIHSIGCNNVNEYLATHDDINDHNEITRSHMISVNLALFGNHCHGGSGGGECTFDYFLHNKSQSTCLENRLATIFEYYKFNEKYIRKLTKLTSHLMSSTGSLLQICIPKEKANDLVYLSQSHGRPYGKVKSMNMNDQQTPIASALDHMCANPDKITDLYAWQARLMFFDPMLDMDPAIKIFRYHTVSDESMAVYQKKLENIVIQIIIDSLRTNYSSITNAMHKEPLFKLYRYIHPSI